MWRRVSPARFERLLFPGLRMRRPARKASGRRGLAQMRGSAPDVALRGRGRAQGEGRWARWLPPSDSARIAPAAAETPGRGVLPPLPPFFFSPAPRDPLLPFLLLPRCGGRGGGPGSWDTMSDSEEESQDRQLKIVVLGDGTSGKVSPRAGPPCQACRNPGAALAPPSLLPAPRRRLMSPSPGASGLGPARSWPGVRH